VIDAGYERASRCNTALINDPLIPKFRGIVLVLDLLGFCGEKEMRFPPLGDFVPQL
jgi:hypothetical protein